MYVLSIIKFNKMSNDDDHLNRNVACLQDIENYAHKVLARNALDYYRSGADQMVSLKDNREAFNRLL